MLALRLRNHIPIGVSARREPADRSETDMRADMEKIYRELSPCDIVMVDVQFDTPDKRVTDLLSIYRELEAS